MLLGYGEETVGFDAEDEGGLGDEGKGGRYGVGWRDRFSGR